jgi:hypothetical protein
VKNEGLPFFLFIVFVGLSVCWIFKKYAHTLAMLYGFVLVSVWYFFKITYHLPTNYLARGSFELERLVYVLPAVSLEFFRIQRWHFLWIFFFFIYLSNLRNSERKKIGVSFVVYVLIFLQLVVYILVYLITPLNPIEHIQGSFDRLLLHLAPLAMFISAISGYAILNNIILLHGKKYKLPRRIDTGDT